MGREASDAGTDRFRRGSGDGTHGRGEWTQHGKPWRWRGTRQPTAREGQVGPCRVAERPVVPGKPGNAGGGKGLSGQVKSEWNGRPSFLMPDRGGAEVDPRGPTAS